jgi:hypothetical protein
MIICGRSYRYDKLNFKSICFFSVSITSRAGFWILVTLNPRWQLHGIEVMI